ncbi:MAG: hypothetical protein ACLS48_13930 [[Eubacterium] siraeum]
MPTKGALRQCIRLGENSDTTLEIKGTDSLSYDGISVPDSSKLLITATAISTLIPTVMTVAVSAAAITIPSARLR